MLAEILKTRQEDVALLTHCAMVLSLLAEESGQAARDVVRAGCSAVLREIQAKFRTSIRGLDNAQACPAPRQLSYLSREGGREGYSCFLVLRVGGWVGGWVGGVSCPVPRLTPSLGQQVLGFQSEAGRLLDAVVEHDPHTKCSEFRLISRHFNVHAGV